MPLNACTRIQAADQDAWAYEPIAERQCFDKEQPAMFILEITFAIAMAYLIVPMLNYFWAKQEKRAAEHKGRPSRMGKPAGRFRPCVERRALMLGQHLDEEGLLGSGRVQNIRLNSSLPLRGKVGDARRQSEIAPFGLW
jgi:hypothetical protein